MNLNETKKVKARSKFNNIHFNFCRSRIDVSQTGAKSKDFISSTPTCPQMGSTSHTPFIALLLYKTSGKFMGMGSIIDKKSVITAAQVVTKSLNKPYTLLILAGRLNSWWGEGSQVQQATEIFVIDLGLALVSLKHGLTFNKNVSPIKIPEHIVPEAAFKEVYGDNWAVFGVQRSSWDIPGEELPKTSIYLMKVESKPASADECKFVYPDTDFNKTIMECTFANGSFNWGCLGSPTVAVTKKNRVVQIGIVVKTTLADTENFHFHLLLQYFHMWIRAHSLIGQK